MKMKVEASYFTIKLHSLKLTINNILFTFKLKSIYREYPIRTDEGLIPNKTQTYRLKPLGQFSLLYIIFNIILNFFKLIILYFFNYKDANPLKNFLNDTFSLFSIEIVLLMHFVLLLL